MLGDCILHAFLNFTEVASLYGFFVAIIIKLPPKLLLHLELKGKKKEEEMRRKRRLGRSRTFLHLVHCEKLCSGLLYTYKSNHQRELLHFSPIHNHSLNL